MELIVFLLIVVVANVLTHKGKKEVGNPPKTKPSYAPKTGQGGFAEWMSSLDEKIKALEGTGESLRKPSPVKVEEAFRTETLPSGELPSEAMPFMASNLEMQDHADYVVEKPAPKLAKKKQRPKHKGSIQEDSTEGIGTEGLGDYHVLYEEHAEVRKPNTAILPNFQKDDLLKAFVLSEILKPKYTEEN